MKILHINDHLAAVGGVETYLLGLVPLLEAVGHEVHVGFASGEDGLVRNQRRLQSLSSIRFRDINGCRQEITKWIRELNPDVVHLHGIQNLGAIQAAVESGRAIMHGHDFRPICPASNFFYKRTKTICERTSGPGCFAVTALRHCMTPRPGPSAYFYRRVRWILKNAARFRHIIAPSGGARGRFLQAGFLSEQITTLPYFCPLEPRDAPRPLPANPTMTFLGRASYNKGWETFIAALGLLSSDIQGLMVGNFSDTDRQNIGRLAKEAGCVDRLRIEGWAGRDAIADIYARTTVFIFPSLWPETMGIVGLEALSQGVPVVASDVGGVREWLKDGENGYLVEPKRADQIAEKAGRLLQDTELNRVMGEHGLSMIKDRFSIDYHMGQLQKIYEGQV